jgi:hypothetical protein
MRTVISRITDKGYVREAEPEAGDTARLSDMLQSRQCPSSVTDRELFRNRGTLADQFSGDERTLDKLVAKAKTYGYTPGTNDFYNSALAAFPGDPMGFVPPTGGRAHIKKVVQMRDQDCEGIVNNKASRYKDPEPEVKLAPKIVERLAQREATLNPEKRRMKKQDLREYVTEKHGS